MNIITLLDLDGVKLARQSGREFSAPCPFCGGRDRFRVKPDHFDGRGSFWCRRCGKGGDAVKYHMLRTGKRYVDACHSLGIQPQFKPRAQRPDEPERGYPPPLIWRKNAAAFVEQTVSILWQERGAHIREFLHGRGADNRSIKAARLGFNPSNKWLQRESWGLPEEEKKVLSLPAGLVIPAIFNDEVHRIRVRSMQEQPEYRYQTISGSSKQPMKFGRVNRIAIVESDLDAILISQEAGDLVSAVSLGSVSLRPDAETHLYLKAAGIILLSLDYDEAGKKESKWWCGQYGAKVKRWPTPAGKDPGEAYKAGVNIREWIKAGLEG